MSVLVTVYFLSKWRFETGKPLALGDFEQEEEPDAAQLNIPFQKANLTFKNIHYTVKASTSDEKLELLKGIDGYVEAGKMTALMGATGGTLRFHR
jgi:ABC-type transport system involved in Fe-S cluster assembly fused permease/ATPase subunit